MNLTSLLKEYSEKLILQMINIYKSQTQDSEDQIKSNIKRFEQLTNSIAKKLADKNPLIVSAIPDDLKTNNKFRDITLYKDYNSLLKVLKAADSKPVDIYKQAIEMYKKQDQYANPQIPQNKTKRIIDFHTEVIFFHAFCNTIHHTPHHNKNHGIPRSSIICIY